MPFKFIVLPLQRKTKNAGAIAQLVEQRTENPCVPGSIPGGTTLRESYRDVALFFVVPYPLCFYPAEWAKADCPNCEYKGMGL